MILKSHPRFFIWIAALAVMGLIVFFLRPDPELEKVFDGSLHEILTRAQKEDASFWQRRRGALWGIELRLRRNLAGPDAEKDISLRNEVFGKLEFLKYIRWQSGLISDEKALTEWLQPAENAQQKRARENLRPLYRENLKRRPELAPACLKILRMEGEAGAQSLCWISVVGLSVAELEAVMADLTSYPPEMAGILIGKLLKECRDIPGPLWNRWLTNLPLTGPHILENILRRTLFASGGRVPAAELNSLKTIYLERWATLSPREENDDTTKSALASWLALTEASEKNKRGETCEVRILSSSQDK